MWMFVSTDTHGDFQAQDLNSKQSGNLRSISPRPLEDGSIRNFEIYVYF